MLPPGWSHSGPGHRALEARRFAFAAHPLNSLLFRATKQYSIPFTYFYSTFSALLLFVPDQKVFLCRGAGGMQARFFSAGKQGSLRKGLS